MTTAAFSATMLKPPNHKMTPSSGRWWAVNAARRNTTAAIPATPAVSRRNVPFLSSPLFTAPDSAGHAPALDLDECYPAQPGARQPVPLALGALTAIRGRMVVTNRLR